MKIAHHRTLLEETFGADLSQTGKPETFLKTVNSPASLEGKRQQSGQSGFRKISGLSERTERPVEL